MRNKKEPEWKEQHQQGIGSMRQLISFISPRVLWRGKMNQNSLKFFFSFSSVGSESKRRIWLLPQDSSTAKFYKDSPECERKSWLWKQLRIGLRKELKGNSNQWGSKNGKRERIDSRVVEWENGEDFHEKENFLFWVRRIHSSWSIRIFLQSVFKWFWNQQTRESS